MRVCRYGFDEDIQGSSTMTHHCITGDSVCRLRSRGGTHTDEAGFTVPQGLQRFLDHDRLSTASSDPSRYFSVTRDDGVIPRLTGCGVFTPYYRSSCEGFITG